MDRLTKNNQKTVKQIMESAKILDKKCLYNASRFVIFFFSLNENGVHFCRDST